MDNTKIILKTDRPGGAFRSSLVGLTPEAIEVVQRLQLQSGLSARQIVSTVLVQAEQLVQVEYKPEGGGADG